MSTNDNDTEQDTRSPASNTTPMQMRAAYEVDEVMRGVPPGTKISREDVRRLMILAFIRGASWEHERNQAGAKEARKTI